LTAVILALAVLRARITGTFWMFAAAKLPADNRNRRGGGSFRQKCPMQQLLLFLQLKFW
jgi:hypothetical protein